MTQTRSKTDDLQPAAGNGLRMAPHGLLLMAAVLWCADDRLACAARIETAIPAGVEPISADALQAVAADDLELMPYRVRLEIAFDRSPYWTPPFRREFVRRVEGGLHRTFGRMWDATVVENVTLPPIGRAALDSISDDQLQRIAAEAYCDKLYLVTLQSIAGQSVDLAGLEWDAAVRRRSSVIKLQINDRREIPSTIPDLTNRLFGPVVRIEEIEGEMVTIRRVAGELRPPDPSVAVLQPGEVLQPIYRGHTREGDVTRVQKLPWTLLQVEDLGRVWGQARTYSGLRMALGGPTRRVSRLGIRIQATSPQTRVKVVTQGESARPLPGLSVRAMVASSEESNESSTAGIPVIHESLTDRWGAVTLAAGDHPLQWISVLSGAQRLAVVPVLLGESPEITLPVQDDTARLTVEAELARLRSRLIDTVAARSLLLMQIRKQGLAGEWDKVDALWPQMDEIETAEVLRGEVTATRVAAFSREPIRSSPLLKTRIRRMCDELADLVKQYLDPTAVENLRTELSELRAVDESEMKRASGS